MSTPHRPNKAEDKAYYENWSQSSSSWWQWQTTWWHPYYETSPRRWTWHWSNGETCENQWMVSLFVAWVSQWIWFKIHSDHFGISQRSSPSPTGGVKSTSPVTENHYKNGYENCIYSMNNINMSDEDNNYDTNYINKHNAQAAPVSTARGARSLRLSWCQCHMHLMAQGVLESHPIRIVIHERLSLTKEQWETTPIFGNGRRNTLVLLMPTKAQDQGQKEQYTNITKITSLKKGWILWIIAIFHKFIPMPQAIKNSGMQRQLWYKMWKTEENSGMAADQSQKQERSDRWSKKDKSSLFVVDGSLSSLEFGVGTSTTEKHR